MENKDMILKIETIDKEFSVCKLSDFDSYFKNLLKNNYVFTAVTPSECSLVCLSEYLVKNFISDNKDLNKYYEDNIIIEREDGWRAFRVAGQLDFALIGIVSAISALMAAEQIPVFVVSTYDTDYFLLKGTDFDNALNILALNGYEISQIS